MNSGDTHNSARNSGHGNDDGDGGVVKNVKDRTAAGE